MKSTLVAVLVLLSGSLWASPLYFNVTVNTGISGTAGNLDFQFNPADASSPAATATITNFAPQASLNGPTATGDVSGDLTTSLVINNSTVFNDYFIAYTFPGQITFQLTFSGAAVDSPTGTGFGSTFFFSLYDSAGLNPLQTTDADGSGSIFSVDLLNTGGTQTNDYSADGASIVVTQVSVPESDSACFILLGLALLAALHRRPEKTFGA
jgi:hypothetical protein